MSRNIENVSVDHLVKYQPEDFVDHPDAQIDMGNDVPFSKEPLADVNTIDNRYPSYEREGFTHRYFMQSCEDSEEVKKIKARSFKRFFRHRDPD